MTPEEKQEIVKAVSDAVTRNISRFIDEKFSQVTPSKPRAEGSPMTAIEAAEYLSISPRKFTDLNKTIPYIIIGKTKRYLKSQLDEWISAQVV